MKEGHLQVANAVAEMLARAKNDNPDAARIRAQREEEAKNALLKEVIATAKASPEATTALKVSMADELHTSWYRDSFLAKLLSAEQIEAVSTKVLIWCHQTAKGITIPDTHSLLTELFVDMQNAVMYSDACLFQHIARTCTTFNIASNQFADGLVKELDKGIFQYALINSGSWSHVVGTTKITDKFQPVSKHELLLTGMLGTYTIKSPLILDRLDEDQHKECIFYTDAFRHPEAKAFPMSSLGDVYLFQRGLDKDVKVTFEDSEDVSYGFGPENVIKGMKAAFDMTEPLCIRLQETR